MIATLRLVLTLTLVALLAVACVSPTVPPTSTPVRATASIAPTSSSLPTPTDAASQLPTDSPTPAPSPTAAVESVTVDLVAADGSAISGTLTATDNGDGTTTLGAQLSDAAGIHPWSLHPGFNCAGTPAEDSQLSTALPDIEQGSASEVVDSGNFGAPLGVFVYQPAAESATPIACGVLPALEWATGAPPTATPTQAPGVPGFILQHVSAMEAAVVGGDPGAYLDLVDQADPVFAIEHARWVEDWAANPPNTFDLSISDVSVSGPTASGVLTVRWSAGGHPPRVANLPVGFSQSEDGSWLYAGEQWQTEELDRFRIRVAPSADVDPADIAADLPDVYSHVTDSLGYEPDGRMEIKVYPDAPSLVATVQLGLPDIHGWNEPGEALKVRLDPVVPSLTPTIAHEFTHFAVFDRAGTQRTRMPWWLDEGLATYVALPFAAPTAGDERMAEVRAWAEDGALAEWSAIAEFETTPQELWPYVYSQGYAMVRFISETYGDEVRNDWLEAMATEMDIIEATDSVLGLTFDELAADFGAWLVG